MKNLNKMIRDLVKNKVRLYFIICLGILNLSSICFAELKSIPEFNKNDRVLILVPHPDDEAIGVAGVIQRAIKAGAQLKVVCSTNGDHNELAMIVYEKRLTFRKGEFIHMGEVRRKETIAAMQYLGMRDKDIQFLGYPDFGTMEIVTKYWGKTKPFKDLLTRISKVPYLECFSPNAPYVGESILKDLKTILLDFKPTKIFVTHPVDTNRDHRSLYLFLQVALWDLEGQISRPQMFPCLIHVVGWPKPRGFHPELRVEPPAKLSHAPIDWQILELSDEEISAKKQAITFYKSQNKAAPAYLFTFARKNELFGDYPPISLIKQTAKEIIWEDTQVFQDEEEEEARDLSISRLAYAQQGANLFVKIGLKRKIDKNFGVSIFLLGYSKTKEFALMPKINLNVNLSGLHIKDKKQTIFVKDARLIYEGRSLIFKIPIALLGNPDYILACIRTNVKDLPLSDTAWRILALD